MKLEYASYPNKEPKPPRDSKCQFGCGFDSKDRDKPLQSIQMHEVRCKLNPERVTWSGTTGVRKSKPRRKPSKTKQQHRKEARNVLEVLRAETAVDQRLARAVGVMFPDGVVISEEFLSWLTTTRKMMLNGNG